MPSYLRTYDSVWGGATPEGTPNDTTTVMLGMVVQAQADGWIVGAQYFRDLADDAWHVAYLIDVATLDLLRTVSFHYKAATGSGADGWQHAYFARQHWMESGDFALLCVWFQAGHSWGTLNALASAPMGAGAVTFPQDGTAYGSGSLPDYNGLYSYDPSLVTVSTYESLAYGIDVLFRAA